MIKKIVKENWGYLLAIILFIIFALTVKHLQIYKYILELDYSIIELTNKIIDKRLTSLFLFLTVFGDWYIPILIIIGTLIVLKNKLCGIILTLNYASAGLLAFITKMLVSRPRPIYSIIESPDQYSFPSGHTLTSLMFFIMLYYLISQTTNNKILKTSLAILLFLLITVIAISRVYLGVHYLSDIIGGIILGTLCVLTNINIIRKNYSEKLK